MVFQGIELICEVCEKTFPRKDMIFSLQNNLAICENCLRNWRLNGGTCSICQGVVNRNQTWSFLREKKTFGHLKCGGVEIKLSTSDEMIKVGGRSVTWALFDEDHIEDQALKYCEFRITVDLGKPEDVRLYPVGSRLICEASGNFFLGRVGEDTKRIIQICQSCDIPESMSKGVTPCLHLIPFRVLKEGEVQSYFACQWFFSIDPKGVHEQRESQCEGSCLFWFPRPKNKPRLFDPKCEKFLRMFLECKSGNS